MPVNADVVNQELATVAPEIAAALAAEEDRQRSTLEMIAPENFASISGRQAQGSAATAGEPRCRVCTLAGRHPRYGSSWSGVISRTR
ncbi:hypothetical protein ACN28C_31530 [Plantactinospora sp. WMMC1484]|uniref:hypothetical protein n=1 Tax=Plantactinospora sp. WMMC1484 TaxID=3404122 RepID=UPI003BF58386